jgi:hypothetical protein
VQLGGREHGARTPPQQLAVLVVRVGGDQLREPIGVRLRGLEPLEHETDPCLPHEQARRVIVLRFVRDVVLLEVRDVVALELAEPASLQLVEGADDTCAAHVDAAEAHRLGLVLGVRGPAVVERGLGVGDDLADRSLDRGRAPRLAEQLLVALVVEEHRRKVVTSPAPRAR